MPRLLRPHVPLKIRCKVIARQIGDTVARGNYQRQLDSMLFVLACALGCFVGDLQLDHDPALENRPFNKRTQKYKPDANDPDYLIYREKHAHHIKTNVRGDGAQLSDAGIARKRKRAERKKTRCKTNWPKRALRSAAHSGSGRYK